MKKPHFATSVKLVSSGDPKSPSGPARFWLSVVMLFLVCMLLVAGENIRLRWQIAEMKDRIEQQERQEAQK